VDVELARPVAGVDYPSTWSQFVAWFATEEACADYLDRLRWRDGFVCPGCGSDRWWPASRGLVARVCAECSKRTTVTAGTVFAGTRKPLTDWFAAAWYVCSTKGGVSALGLQRVLGLSSYETAWSWLHKLRHAMVVPGRDLLTGDVEVDETFVGGPDGAQGRRLGKKALVVIGAEVRGTATGRIRLARIPDASHVWLEGFITTSIEPASTLLTDGWPAYLAMADKGYIHKPVSVRATTETASDLLPHVHRTASLLKRWLLGTHQGAVEPEYLDFYLDEFTFRFNRRRSRSRGMLFYRLLEQAVRTQPHPTGSFAGRTRPVQMTSAPGTARTGKHKM
jgi:transposase-like protein